MTRTCVSVLRYVQRFLFRPFSTNPPSCSQMRASPRLIVVVQRARGFEMEVGSNGINERFSADYNLRVVYSGDYRVHKSKKYSYAEADFL